jgi:hypothetical protein
MIRKRNRKGKRNPHLVFSEREGERREVESGTRKVIDRNGRKGSRNEGAKLAMGVEGVGLSCCYQQ